MDTLTDKAIDLAAKHAAEFVRLLGRQEQERQELLRRHWTETRTLQLAERAGGEGLPYEAPTVTPLGNLFDLFGGVVRPPADAPPGVPMPVSQTEGDPARPSLHWDLSPGATEKCTATNPCRGCVIIGHVHSISVVRGDPKDSPNSWAGKVGGDR